MSQVHRPGGAVLHVRDRFKSKRVHLRDRRAWWTGYADAWNGLPCSTTEPWYAEGHREGAEAVARRADIRIDKARTDSLRTAAPELMRRLERLSDSAWSGARAHR